MVGAPAQRQQVAYASARGLSQRFACALLRTARSSLHYASTKTPTDAPVVTRMRELASQYPRYGYRRIRVFLGRDGHRMGYSRQEDGQRRTSGTRNALSRALPSTPSRVATAATWTMSPLSMPSWK